MKLPFVLVPRVVFDQMVKANDEERERTRRLTKTIVQMKVAGGTVQRAALGGRLPPRQVSEFDQQVADAIESNKHSRRPGFAAAQMGFVERELAKGTDKDKILDRLRNWSRVDRSVKDDDNDTIAIVSG